MTPDRAACLNDLKNALLADMQKHGPEGARDIYDWLAVELNKQDEATGNVHYLNARERIERTKT